MHTIENGTPARIMVMYVSAMQIKYGFPKKKKRPGGGVSDVAPQTPYA